MFKKRFFKIKNPFLISIFLISLSILPFNKTHIAEQTINGAISIIDGLSNQVIDTVETNIIPGLIGVNPITNLIYEGSSPLSSLMVAIGGTTNNVLKTITICQVGGNPSNIAINSDTNLIYEGTQCNDFSVEVIDGDTNMPTS